MPLAEERLRSEIIQLQSEHAEVVSLKRSLRNGLAYDKRGEFDEATKQYAASLDLLPKLAEQLPEYHTVFASIRELLEQRIAKGSPTAAAPPKHVALLLESGSWCTTTLNLALPSDCMTRKLPKHKSIELIRTFKGRANLQEDLQSPDEASLPFSEFLVIPPGSSTQVLAAAKMPEFVLSPRSGSRVPTPSIPTIQLSSSPLTNSGHLSTSPQPTTTISTVVTAHSSSSSSSYSSTLGATLLMVSSLALSTELSPAATTDDESSASAFAQPSPMPSNSSTSSFGLVTPPMHDPLLALAQPSQQQQPTSRLEDIFEPPASEEVLDQQRFLLSSSPSSDAVNLYKAMLACLLCPTESTGGGFHKQIFSEHVDTLQFVLGVTPAVHNAIYMDVLTEAEYTLPFLYWRLESLHDHRYYFPGNFRSKDSYTTSLEQEKLRLQRVIAELRKAPDFEGSLEINIIEGVNLGKGKKVSDPFCVCELGMQRVRTKIKRKTRSPQWNEKFILPVPNPEAVLHLVVWDDQLISNDLLGKVQLPLSGLIDQRSHINWHPLMGKSLSQNYGEICVSVHFTFRKLSKEDELPSEMAAAVANNDYHVWYQMLHDKLVLHYGSPTNLCKLPPWVPWLLKEFATRYGVRSAYCHITKLELLAKHLTCTKEFLDMLYKELEEILQDSSAVFTLSEQKSLRKLKVQILSFLEKQLDEYQKAFPITLIPGTQGSSGHRRQGSGTTFKPSSFSRATGAALALNQSGLSSASYSPSQSSPMQAATLSPLAASAPIPPLEPYRMQGSSPNWDSRALKATIQLISLLNNHDEGKLVQLLSIHLKNAMEANFTNKLLELEEMYSLSPRAVVIEFLVAYVAAWIYTDITYFATQLPSKVNLRGLSIITYYSLLTKEIHEFFTNTPKDSWESVNHSLFRIYSNLLRLHSLIEFMPLAQWGVTLLPLKELFSPYFCMWLLMAEPRLRAWTHQAIKQDDWNRLSDEDRHSRSVEQVVAACLQGIEVLVNVDLDVEYQLVRYAQELRGIFELYASELLQLCMDDTRSFYEQRDSVLAADFIEIYQLRLDQGKTTTPLADLTRTMCVRVNSIQAIKWKFRAVKARFIEMVDGDAVFALQDSAEDTEKTLEHAVAEVLNVIIEKMNVIMYPLLEAMLSEKSVDCAFVSASLARLLCFLNLELGLLSENLYCTLFIRVLWGVWRTLIGNLESIIFPLAYEKLTEHASVRQQQACLVQYFIDANLLPFFNAHGVGLSIEQLTPTCETLRRALDMFELATSTLVELHHGYSAARAAQSQQQQQQPEQEQPQQPPPVPQQQQPENSAPDLGLYILYILATRNTEEAAAIVSSIDPAELEQRRLHLRTKVIERYRCKNAYRIPGMLLLTGSSFYFISEHNAVRTCNSYEDLAAAVIVSGEPSEQYLLLRGNSLSYKFYADDPQTILQSLVRLCGERIHRSLSDLHLLIPDVASCITEPVIQDFEAAMVRERATYYGSLVVTREALYFVQYGPQDRREIRVSLPLASIKSASEYVDITKLPTSLAIETRANETIVFTSLYNCQVALLAVREALHQYHQRNGGADTTTTTTTTSNGGVPAGVE